MRNIPAREIEYWDQVPPQPDLLAQGVIKN